MKCFRVNYENGEFHPPMDNPMYTLGEAVVIVVNGTGVKKIELANELNDEEVFIKACKELCPSFEEHYSEDIREAIIEDGYFNIGNSFVQICGLE